MTPGARIAAAIELLELIEAENRPADRVVDGYMRQRRYIGSKDRVAVTEQVYAVLRRRARLDWWIARAGLERSWRRRVIANLALGEGWPLDRITSTFDGTAHSPKPLGDADRALVAELAGRPFDSADMAEIVRADCPEWLEARLRRRFGDRFLEELQALSRPAGVDLRVNVLKADRPTLLAEFQAAEIPVEPTPFSPLGLRLAKRRPVDRLPGFAEGRIEVQDEGSQLAALLVDAQPGMRVVDFCAGAGGKTLAMGAAMANRGHIGACDVSERRLEHAARRLRRAGLANVERRVLTSERDPWVKRHKGSFDRVLIDAPCSGTGTWRRNPDAKWWLTPKGLDELAAQQHSILESAARLVKPGGRLVYVTCALLDEENEGQIDRFLATHADFAPLPVGEVWPATVGGTAPEGGAYLRLSPAAHGTDGFFVAILARAAGTSGA
jgi:16S rRNA (cytosine967-C5)-methyltransferase